MFVILHIEMPYNLFVHFKSNCHMWRLIVVAQHTIWNLATLNVLHLVYKGNFNLDFAARKIFLGLLKPNINYIIIIREDNDFYRIVDAILVSFFLYLTSKTDCIFRVLTRFWPVGRPGTTGGAKTNGNKKVAPLPPNYKEKLAMARHIKHTICEISEKKAFIEQLFYNNKVLHLITSAGEYYITQVAPLPVNFKEKVIVFTGC